MKTESETLNAEPRTLNVEEPERPMLFSGEMVRAIIGGTKTQTRRVVKVDCLDREQKKIGFEQNPDAASPGTLSWIAALGGSKEAVRELARDQQLNVPVRHPDEKNDPNFSWEDCARNRIYCPYGGPDERLWVKETFTTYRTKTKSEHRKPEPILKGFFDGKFRSEAEFLEKALEIPLGTGGINVLYAADFGDWAYDVDADLGPWKPSIFMPRNLSRITLEIESVRVERVRDISEADAKAEGIIPVPKTTPNAHQFWRDYGLSGDGTFCVPDPIRSYQSLWNSINLKPKPIYARFDQGGEMTREIVSYQSFPWSNADFDAKYPGARAAGLYRGKPMVVAENPWVWVISFKRVENGAARPHSPTLKGGAARV